MADFVQKKIENWQIFNKIWQILGGSGLKESLAFQLNQEQHQGESYCEAAIYEKRVH